MKAIWIVLACTVCFFACKKENADYRDKYVGDYDFAIVYTYPTLEWVDSFENTIITYYDSVYSYQGYIHKSAQADDRVLIHWGVDTIVIKDDIVFNQSNDMMVDSDGMLTYPEFPDGGYTYLSNASYLRNDSAKFKFSNGGLGAYALWNVIGTKK